MEDAFYCLDLGFELQQTYLYFLHFANLISHSSNSTNQVILITNV